LFSFSGVERVSEEPDKTGFFVVPKLPPPSYPPTNLASPLLISSSIVRDRSVRVRSLMTVEILGGRSRPGLLQWGC
jgi:hypothetical protein